MKPGFPWSVKGVEPEVRAAAKTAARRAGMTLGEWLNSVILDQNEHIIDSSKVQNAHFEERFLSSAPHEPGPAAQETPQREAPRAQASTRRDDSALRLQDIAQQLAHLAQKERQSAAIQPFEAARRPGDDEEAMARLLERIDDNERQTVEALTAVNERLSRLGQQMAMQPRAPLFDRPEDVPGYSALESAIRNVVEHIEVSEKRTRDSLKSMQDRLGELAEQAALQPRPEDVQRTAPLIASLEARVAELSNRLLRAESVLQAASPEAMRRDIGQLGERIESVKASADQMAKQAQTSAAGIARSEMREIETRMLASLREAQAAVPDLGQLRGEMGGLARRMDEIRASAATERDLNALRVAVEQISTRVAQGPDMRPVAELDRRLGDLGRRLDQVAAATGGSAQVKELEARIAELGRRLEDGMSLKADPRAMDQLAKNIATVSERVGRTEEQLRHIETMEQAIRQLYESLEQSRDAANQAAEQAASRTVERLMAAGVPTGPSPELRALEDGLRAVRESAAGAERRNQETLAAVHETLSQIVEKIAELEAGGARASAAPQPASASRADVVPSGYQPVPPADPYSSLGAGAAGPAPATSDGLPPLSASDDFIAAARRAAQAAASRPSALRAEFSAMAPPPEEESGFSLFRRFRRQPKPEPLTPAASAAMPPRDGGVVAVASRRRRLLLAGMVLLAAVSAFTYSVLVKKPAAPPATPSALETPAPQEPQKQGRTDLPADQLFTGSLTTPADAAVMPPPESGTLALREAAAAGDPSAQFIIAGRYMDGEGVAQDFGMAAQWYRLAAEAGLAPAQYRLATLLERGKGMPQDMGAALSWYEKAAAQGNVKSMHNAAVLIVSGQPKTADHAKAFTLFSGAAERGLRDSQFNLAILYERGLGTTASKAEAYFWYRLAAGQGDTHAAERSATIAKSLPAGELSRLAARLAGWSPWPSEEAANTVAILDPAWQEPDTSVLASAAAVPSASAPVQDVVTEAQQLLALLGFNVGAPDGKLGTRTASAIRLFQLQSGLEVTGQITPEVLNAMRAKAG